MWRTNIAGNNKHAADIGAVPKTTRRVGQYTTKGKLLKEFESVIAAAKEIGISDGHIVNACKGKIKKAGGYVWKYLDAIPAELTDVDLSEFKPIKTFPTYLVNKEGKVYSKYAKRIMKTQAHKEGGEQLQLTKRNPASGQIKKTVLIHNLVASYFLEKPYKKKVNSIHHIDGNKKNNNVRNLEWKHVSGVSPNFNI